MDKEEGEKAMINKIKRLVLKMAGMEVHRGGLGFDEIRKLIQREDPVILEIGAYNGRDTANFIESFPKGKIYCFEPDPRAVTMWRNRIKASNAELHEIAICHTNGVLTFHQSHSDEREDGGLASGSIRVPKEHLNRWPEIKFDKKIQVMGRRLDDWCSEHGISDVDFIWADVQGAEKDLIAGASKILQRTRFFYTEYYNQEMYEGQWNLKQMTRCLPHHKLEKRFVNDALFALRSSSLK